MKRLFIFSLLILSLLNLHSQDCLPDGIIFTTQAQIDSFPVDYPDCSRIGGDVKIIGEDITNLDSLKQLSYIGGSLYIGSNLYQSNPLLTDISGLSNLDSIGVSLSIIANPLLQDLNALTGVVKMDGSLTIINNASLENINGVQNISSAGISQLSIFRNPVLSLCDLSNVCSFLSSPSGKVTVYANAEGCESPVDIANRCGIQLSCLPYGDYNFTKQSQLDDFQSDYGICDTLFGNVNIRGEDITNLSGLTNVETIVGTLSISGNPRLKSLDGLENLTTVFYSLAIGGVGLPFDKTENDSLTDLTALTNLTKVHLSLIIGNNYSLTNLSGLENIVLGSMGHVNIFNNPLLSECAIESVCNLIASGGTLEITNNKSGCNSQQEIKEECLLSVSNLASGRPPKIYPNPFTTSTTIDYYLTKSQTVTITFYNQFGKEVDRIEQKQTAGKQQVIWKAGGLPPGIYYFTLKAGGLFETGKLVKVD